MLFPDTGLEREKQGFDEFWAECPRHEAKADALKAWIQTARVRPPLLVLLKALRNAIAANDWTPARRLVTPLPASWLRGQRWDDEFPDAAASKPAIDPRVALKAAAMRAWSEVRLAIQRDALPNGGWADPITAPALAGLGGFGVVRDMQTRDVPHRQREFVEFYMAHAAGAISPAQQRPAAGLRLVASR